MPETPESSPAAKDPAARACARPNLARAFSHEWDDLASESDEERIITDFLLANEEDGIGITQYADRIGYGNLVAYAACLAASAI